MGRPPGESTNAGPGHNGSALTDDELRALALHHKRAFMAADALVESAKAARTEVANMAKADLGKGGLSDIRQMILFDDEAKARTTIENSIRLARWSGIPIGRQLDLFGDKQSDHVRHEHNGKTSGMAGDNCQPPTHLAPGDAQLWIRGWHEGQAILASAFGKKRHDHAADHKPADTSDPPFAANENAA